MFNIGGCLKRLVAILPGRCGGTRRENMLQLRTLLDRGGEGKRAVIVSVEQYYPWVSLQRRLGATKDARKLHSTLNKMGFKVELHLDLSSDDIYELFHNGRQRESIPECNVCCLVGWSDPRSWINSCLFCLIKHHICKICMQVAAAWAGQNLVTLD